MLLSVFFLCRPLAVLSEQIITLSPAINQFSTLCTDPIVQESRTFSPQLPPSRFTVPSKHKGGGGGGLFGFGGNSKAIPQSQGGEYTVYQHGLEQPSNDSKFLDLDMSVSRVAAPQAVEREAVLLHYLVDSRIDSTLRIITTEQYVAPPTTAEG
jgi:hypothetical protein